MPSPTRTLQPSRGLLHPLFWCALGVLLLNDHVWKYGDALPSALTGKLSDFAGLLVAPLVLAVALRAHSQRALQICHLAVAAAFAAINLSELAAGALVAAMAAVHLHWQIWSDPTDLIALPAAWFGYRIFRDAAEGPKTVRALWGPALKKAGFVAGMVGCLATSRAPPARVAADAAHVYLPDPDEERGVIFLDITTGRQLRRSEAILDLYPRPAVVGDALIGWQRGSGDQRERIIGIDTKTGRLRFQAEPADGYSLKPFVAAGDQVIMLQALYSLDSSVELTAYHAQNGRKAWSQRLEDSMDFNMHARDDTLVVAEQEHVRRIDPASGATLWKTELLDDVVSLTSMAERVFAQVDDGTVVVLEERTGRVLLSRPLDSLRYHGWTTLTGSLTASTQALFLDADEGIMVLDAQLRLRQLIPELGRPYAEGDVVIATFGTYYYRLDPTDGHIHWRYQSDIWSDYPTLTPSAVILAGDDTIIALDAQTGHERWRHEQ